MASATVSGKVDKKEGQGSSTEEIPWLEAEQGYDLGIAKGKLVCRNPKGKKLSSVPKWLKETPLADQLIAMCDWLTEHRVECLRRVELWMLRSLPVPREVLASVWPDPDWREMLQNLVVTAVDRSGQADANQTGLLRDVDLKQGGIGIVDRDGETQWLKSPQILIPHPILIEGLDDLREIAADMQFSQAVEQIFRPIFVANDDLKSQKRVTQFSGGKFQQLNFAMSLCRRLGYLVRGGSACCKVWEGGTPLEARYWIGDEYPESETYTGDLIFVDEKQTPIEIGQVGAVTFSEGMRMASSIYAKRTIEKEEGDDQ